MKRSFVQLSFGRRLILLSGSIVGGTPPRSSKFRHNIQLLQPSHTDHRPPPTVHRQLHHVADHHRVRQGHLLSYPNLRRLPAGIQAMAMCGLVPAVRGAEGRRIFSREGPESYDSFGEPDGDSEESEFSPGSGRVR